MRNAASWSFTIGTGLLVTVAGLVLKLNVLIVLTGAILAAGVVFYFIDYRTRPDRRVFLSVPTAQLRQLYDGRTTLQAEKAVSIYIGKWMRVSGQVQDIHDFIHRTISLEGPERIFLNFRKNKDRLEVIHKGDTVEVVGKVKRITPHHITLDYCELVSVETEPSPASPPSA